MHHGRYPLSGLRVLDLSRVLAGPVCCQLLADLGADVVKLERPGTGDDTRAWGPPFLPAAGASAYFLSCNRGKRSLAVDLAAPAAGELLRQLIRQADVLVENFRPETARRLGLHPGDLAQLNPRLVSASISGYGRDTPQADLPGYDLAIQAASGLMSITGPPDGPPYKVGVALADVLTGLYAAASILAGLTARARDATSSAFPAASDSAAAQPAVPVHPGWHFDLALFDCTLASLVNIAQASLLTGQAPERLGNAHPQIVPYELFATADGHLVLAVGNDSQFVRLAELLLRPEWKTSPLFATNPARVRHRQQLVPQIAALLCQQPTAHWVTQFTAAAIPHSVVADVAQALATPYAAARGLVQSVCDSSGREYPLLGSAVHWQGQPPQNLQAPPALGQHTREVLQQWLDYSPEQIAALLRDKVVDEPRAAAPNT